MIIEKISYLLLGLTLIQNKQTNKFCVRKIEIFFLWCSTLDEKDEIFFLWCSTLDDVQL